MTTPINRDIQSRIIMNLIEMDKYADDLTIKKLVKRVDNGLMWGYGARYYQNKICARCQQEIGNCNPEAWSDSGLKDEKDLKVIMKKLEEHLTGDGYVDAIDFHHYIMIINQYLNDNEWWFKEPGKKRSTWEPLVELRNELARLYEVRVFAQG
jgi:hypothetical protein